MPLGTSRPGPSSAVISGHPLFGEAAPDIQAQTLDGETVDLSDLRGRPVMVNFWATWCIPCREEFPLMVDAYDEYRETGLEILGVIHDDAADRAREFALQQGAGWPMLQDPDDVVWDDYLGAVMPTSFFIDGDGIVRAFSIGGFSETGLEAQLQRILPEAPPSPSSTPAPGSSAAAEPG